MSAALCDAPTTAAASSALTAPRGLCSSRPTPIIGSYPDPSHRNPLEEATHLGSEPCGLVEVVGRDGSRFRQVSDGSRHAQKPLGSATRHAFELTQLDGALFGDGVETTRRSQKSPADPRVQATGRSRELTFA